MVSEEPKQSPQDQKESNPVAENGQSTEGLFSPRFKSVAAMAGWDEEAILVATLVVEDTPDRESKQKRRFDLQFKTPPSNLRRKRRAQKRSPVSIPITVLALDEEESATRQESSESDKKTVQLNEEKETNEEKRVGEDEAQMLLSRAWINFGTSFLVRFCKKCLRSAADKCGKKCPKCRQLISNGRSCTVNTVLWNTIQLLFPQVVEARKSAGALNSSWEAEDRSPQRGGVQNNVRTRSMRYSAASSRDMNTRRREIPQSQDEDAASTLRWERQNLARPTRRRSTDSLEDENQNRQRRSIRPSAVSSRDASTRRRGIPSQDEDAALALRLERENLARLLSRDARARRRGDRRSENEDDDAVLALRLQREEFMEAFSGGSHEQQQSGAASRATNIRMRGGRPF